MSVQKSVSGLSRDEDAIVHELRTVERLGPTGQVLMVQQTVCQADVEDFYRETTFAGRRKANCRFCAEERLWPWSRAAKAAANKA